ncbi:MAG: hypothetical protein JO358_04435 [Alphaproteobacteria bacterium]|nr:hypothetical protein [Alphaproteobacteria bacterium]MBV8398920.1 hypothetical protein [Acetobacteraceae bacterium]
MTNATLQGPFDPSALYTRAEVRNRLQISDRLGRRRDNCSRRCQQGKEQMAPGIHPVSHWR